MASWPWEWSATAWSALTFFVLLGAAVATAWQVREARRSREEQIRPFVIIDFHPWSTIIEIRITNSGATLARDVTFTFDPPLASTRDSAPGETSVAQVNIFKGGIPSLAPRREIKFFFDQFPARVEQKLPMKYDVTVSYRDHRGKRWTDATVLDLSMYLGTSGIHRGDLHDIHKHLKEIADNVKKWTDSDGLKVMTRSDRQKREAEWEALIVERQAALAAQTPDDPASEPA